MGESDEQAGEAGPATTVMTPWGDASQLRSRSLKPGPGLSRIQTERVQRERLLAATAATVAEKGYGAMTVADLVALSGVSRKTFYLHFSDKKHCFLAAVDALIGPALEQGIDDASLVGDETHAQESFEGLIEQIASQSAAAKMCLVEIYAAGPEAVVLLDRIVDGLEQLATTMFEQIPGRKGMPPEIVRAIIGGAQKVVHRALLRNEEEELSDLGPELWEWIMSIPPPPGPLQPSERRHARRGRFADRQKRSSPRERVMRGMAAAVSEKGYEEAKVVDVVEKATTSLRTFYEYFANKEDAMLAALDWGSAEVLAVGLPAFRSGADWRHSVRDMQEAMLGFGAEEPEYARLGAVELYGAGKRALERRERVTEGLEELLAEGFELAPDTPPIVAETIAGAIYALLYDFVNANGPGRLLELVPTATYVTLAPFVGAEEAYEVAVG